MPMVPQQTQIDEVRRQIIGEVVAAVRAAAGPVPLEALADRALRAVGHDKTIGTSWGGSGSFRELLRQSLPQDIRLADDPPYHAIDLTKPVVAAAPFVQPQPVVQRPAVQRVEPRTVPAVTTVAPAAPAPVYHAPAAPVHVPAPPTAASVLDAPQSYVPPVRHDTVRQEFVERGAPAAVAPPAPPKAQPASPQASAPPARQAYQSPSFGGRHRGIDASALSMQTLTKIQDACQAPRLAPGDYRVLFDVMATEISENHLSGSQTLANISERAREKGVEIGREDVRFVLEVVSEADPWFEQGVSATVFAGRFRNFVVARCRSQGLNLSADELDLIDAVFVGAGPIAPLRAAPVQQSQQPAPVQVQAPAAVPAPVVERRQAAPAPAVPPQPERRSRWWSLEEGRQHVAEQRQPQAAAAEETGDDFPRIIRSRLRG